MSRSSKTSTKSWYSLGSNGFPRSSFPNIWHSIGFTRECSLTAPTFQVQAMEQRRSTSCKCITKNSMHGLPTSLSNPPCKNRVPHFGKANVVNDHTSLAYAPSVILRRTFQFVRLVPEMCVCAACSIPQKTSFPESPLPLPDSSSQEQNTGVA